MSQNITKDDINKLRVAFTASEATRVRSLDFCYNGKKLLYNVDDKITMLSLTEDKVKMSAIPVRKYGAKICKFVGSDHCVHSSNYSINEDCIRLVEINSFKYISYFSGHKAEVVSLAVSKDMCFSGSRDKTAKLWDLRQADAVKDMEFPSTPLIAFHPAGETIAIAHDSRVIKIYKMSNLNTHLSAYEFEKVESVVWTGLQFSPNGAMLLATTNLFSVLIFNPAKKEKLNNLRGSENPDNYFIGACFSSQSNFVFGGSSLNGVTPVWDLKTSQKVCDLKSGYVSPSYLVAFNPAFMNLATAGTDVHLWIENDP